tara:strand:- start:509 stop:757 length:249 start_codon:yes stop_codon:yes gene_type:complete
MRIFILFSIIISIVVFIVRHLIYSAKRNLFKDQAAWSGKDIKIKYKGSNEVSERKEDNNFLKIIADESINYLKNQSKNAEEK